jgi:membrane-associated PAP2 superfamily phosphatase
MINTYFKIIFSRIWQNENGERIKRTSHLILIMDKIQFIKARFWILGGFILLLGTILFRLNDGELDKAITDLAYNSSAPIGTRFALGDQEPWSFFNDFNGYFTGLLIAGLLIMLLLGLIKRDKYGFLIRYALFGIFSVAIGVGLVVNEIFKGLWGRPRPRMTAQWPDGTNIIGPFYMVWDPTFLIDPTLIGEGVSFPSGHVSIIAAYIVIFYIFMNIDTWVKHTQKPAIIFQILKWTGFLFALIGGIMTGIARICAGAHHASDVLWAFGMVWIINAVIFYWVMRIPKHELITA